MSSMTTLVTCAVWVSQSCASAPRGLRRVGLVRTIQCKQELRLITHAADGVLADEGDGCLRAGTEACARRRRYPRLSLARAWSWISR